MQFLRFFIIFSVSYASFDWIIRKTDIHNRLFTKCSIYKYTRIILISVLILLRSHLNIWLLNPYFYPQLQRVDFLNIVVYAPFALRLVF